MYAKTIKRHLKNGGRLEDWLFGEPGRCSNGGNYYTIYRFKNNKVVSRSSYEDADFEVDDKSLDALAEFASKHWHDEPHFISGPRFSLT